MKSKTTYKWMRIKDSMNFDDFQLMLNEWNYLENTRQCIQVIPMFGTPVLKGRLQRRQPLTRLWFACLEECSLALAWSDDPSSPLSMQVENHLRQRWEPPSPTSLASELARIRKKSETNIVYNISLSLTLASHWSHMGLTLGSFGLS